MSIERIDRLFGEHSRELFAFLVYRTGDRSAAEDLVADTFEHVLRSRHRFNPLRGSEKAWIYTIALNLARDQARRTVVEHRAVESVASEVMSEDLRPALESVHDRDELRHAMARLNQEERDVIALRFGADLTLREIARVLEEGESAVEGRLYRGLRKLRDELG